MAIPLRPKLRPLELFPAGPKEEMLFVLRDPEGYGETKVLPCGAALLVTLMDGQRTLAEIQTAFGEETGARVALAKLEQLIQQLDRAYLLASERFDAFHREQVQRYLGNPIRPASHAGDAYPVDAAALRQQLDEFFTREGGPGAVEPGSAAKERRVSAVISPHIDPQRGGTTYAWTYRWLAEQSDADLFVIFGTSHRPVHQLFCATRKDFDTPLGLVPTDGAFVDRLAAHLSSSVAGQQIDLFEDELVHRYEHSIEFQVVFLQHVLGARRPFRIVPILTGSFQEFLTEGTPPADSPEVQCFLAAVKAAAAGHPGKVCYVAAADLAHIGQRFGDEWLLEDDRLAQQAADDRRLLEAACRGDPQAVFRHVAEQQDISRICGLAPIYTLLELIRPVQGELLKYDQAVDPDRTSCVSFASVAYHPG